MKHRRPKFRLKFRPKEDRREEYEPEEGGFFLEDATFWEMVVAGIKGSVYGLIAALVFGIVAYALVGLVVLLLLLL